MAMIDRYKKNGGFLQLLRLIETCGKIKREKFIETIRLETPEWAEALEKKCLSFERILSWKPEIVLDILSQINHQSFTTALKILSENEFNNFLEKLSHQEKRKITAIYVEINPTPAEISASTCKVISDTRDLIVSNFINIEKVDPDLALPYNFEQSLEQLSNEKNGQKELVKFLDSSPPKKINSLDKNKESKLIFVGTKHKVDENVVSLSDDIESENRPEVLKEKLREVTKQLRTLANQYRLLRLELEALKQEKS